MLGERGCGLAQWSGLQFRSLPRRLTHSPARSILANPADKWTTESRVCLALVAVRQFAGPVARFIYLSLHKSTDGGKEYSWEVVRKGYIHTS